MKHRQRKKQLARLKKEGLLGEGIVIPEGALLADTVEQRSNSGFLRYWYLDVSYVCDGCQRECVWTKEQQKRYFEVQKGNIYNSPKWCHDCHRERMNARRTQSK